MKNIFKKINKKFLGIFVVLVLLECLFIFSQIFGWIETSVPLSDNFLMWSWFLPGTIWFLPFLDGSVGGEMWFMLLFMVGVLIIPAAFWTTVVYFLNRLVKIIQTKSKNKTPLNTP